MAINMQKTAMLPARISRVRTVVCLASRCAVTSRRAALGVTMLPAILLASQARALIPDEEDEDLVEKAKANRRARLAQQRGVTRDFMASENLKDVRLEQELLPVQKAVYKLMKSGCQLEAGNLKAAASTLSESWVADFTSVASTVSGSDAAVKLVFGIKGVQSAAAAGDLVSSKQQFVALVSDLRSWAFTTGLASSLKGL